MNECIYIYIYVYTYICTCTYIKNTYVNIYTSIYIYERDV